MALSSASPSLCVALVTSVIAGACVYRVAQTLQGSSFPHPRLPQPPIHRLKEDGVLMGFVKRALYGHFYSLKQGESLMRMHEWCSTFHYRPFIIRMVLRLHIVLCCCHDVEQVLLIQEAKFYKRNGYDLVRFVTGDGLLAVGNKKKHATHRRIFASLFSSSNVRGLSNEITRVHAVTLMTDLLDAAQCSGEESAVVNLSEHINNMALGAIGEAAFRATREEITYLRKFFSTLSRIGKLNYFCPYYRTGPQKEAMRRIHEACNRLMKKNVELEAYTGRRVVVDALMDELHEHFDQQDVVDHIVTFLFAGHDTTSQTMQLLFALLASHPEAQAALFEELEALMPAGCVCPTVEVLQECPYLVAVAKEVLRLFPAAPLLFRNSMEDVYLPHSDVVIPNGTTVIMDLFSLHRNPDIFGTDACLFRPERWVGIEGRDLEQRCGACGYIPFSCGRRNCIGQDFAYQELLIVTAQIVRNMQLDAVESMPETRFMITLTTNKPVRVRIHPRAKSNSSSAYAIGTGTVVPIISHKTSVIDSSGDAAGLSSSGSCC